MVNTGFKMIVWKKEKDWLEQVCWKCFWRKGERRVETTTPFNTEEFDDTF